MKHFNFPVFKTKTEGLTKKFNLEDPADRQRYFKAKAGPEIEKLSNFLKTNTFVGFLMGKKSSGKGTYSKLFKEMVGEDSVVHISVGDIVRKTHKELHDKDKKKELVKFLEKNYRGFITIEQALDVILGRDTTTLLPTEMILALVKREINKIGRKAVFIDGLPRAMDQISYSLFFRELMGYRDDPDFFVFIDLPEKIIDERMKGRVTCPHCQTPRNLRVLRTSKVGHDKEKDEFYLMCDKPGCNGARMLAKEGDNLGIENIRERINTDHQIMEKLLNLQGVPKVYIRNAVPKNKVAEYVDDYEITPASKYKLAESGNVEITEEPWTVTDDDGEELHSLLAPPVGISFVKQLVKILEL